MNGLHNGAVLRNYALSFQVKSLVMNYVLYSEWVVLALA